MIILCKSIRISYLLKKIKYDDFSETMNIPTSIMDYIKYNQLKWYGQIQRMGHERLPKILIIYNLHERRKEEDHQIHREAGWIKLYQKGICWKEIRRIERHGGNASVEFLKWFIYSFMIRYTIIIYKT